MIDMSRRQSLPRALHPLGLALGLAFGMAAAPAAADEDAAEYREHVMESIGGHMQAAVAILRQKVPHQGHLRLHVHAMADMASIAHTLFPEGSEGGDALPEIWENPDDFATRVDAFQTAAAGLKTAVDNGGDIGPAFQKVGQACKGCHDNYREE